MKIVSEKTNRSSSPTGAITLSAGNSVIEGFTATGSASHEFYHSAGIWVNSHNNQIKGIVPISATCTLSILHLVKSVIFAQRIEKVK
jgi:hypothetical protein